ncbi:MAG: serine/threonine-protein kinase [Planctomycetota bacterium]
MGLGRSVLEGEGLKSDLPEGEGLRRGFPGEEGSKASGRRQTDTDGPRRIGRFQIIRELGRGGHGIVFLAFDPALRREVALKVPRPEVLASPEMRRRFIGEAHAAGRLKHPNIIDVHDIGDLGPVYYITWDYCPGGTLADYLRKAGGDVSPNLAARVLAEVADGVQYAHEHGVLHRDIKPSNVLLTKREGRSSNLGKADEHTPEFTPVLTDFGLARVTEGTRITPKSSTLFRDAGLAGAGQGAIGRDRTGDKRLWARRGALRDACRPAGVSRRHGCGHASAGLVRRSAATPPNPSLHSGGS